MTPKSKRRPRGEIPDTHAAGWFPGVAGELKTREIPQFLVKPLKSGSLWLAVHFSRQCTRLGSWDDVHQ